jgi:hypothetical protein
MMSEARASSKFFHASRAPSSDLAALAAAGQVLTNSGHKKEKKPLFCTPAARASVTCVRALEATGGCCWPAG